jgi:hypothetical protein
VQATVAKERGIYVLNERVKLRGRRAPVSRVSTDDGKAMGVAQLLKAYEDAFEQEAKAHSRAARSTREGASAGDSQEAGPDDSAVAAEAVAAAAVAVAAGEGGSIVARFLGPAGRGSEKVADPTTESLEADTALERRVEEELACARLVAVVEYAANEAAWKAGHVRKKAAKKKQKEKKKEKKKKKGAMAGKKKVGPAVKPAKRKRAGRDSGPETKRRRGGGRRRGGSGGSSGHGDRDGASGDGSTSSSDTSGEQSHSEPSEPGEQRIIWPAAVKRRVSKAFCPYPKAGHAVGLMLYKVFWMHLPKGEYTWEPAENLLAPGGITEVDLEKVGEFLPKRKRAR